jgi:hypothetical protein
MIDPRAANCRAYADENGLVTGVLLAHIPVPSARFELVRVDLIDEASAAGQHIASIHVLDALNLPTPARVYLAWPWHNWTFPARFEEMGLPGNPNIPYQHMITNGYNPPQVGPTAIFVGDASGNVISDVCGGFGLPFNRHVCYSLIFRERAAVEPPPGARLLPSQETATDAPMLADKVRWWMEEYVRQSEQGARVYATAILYDLIRLDDGLLYRLERKLKGQ